MELYDRVLDSYSESFVYGLFGLLPLLLVWTGGALVCLVRFRRHRLFHLLVGTALTIQLVVMLVHPPAIELLLYLLASWELISPYFSPRTYLVVSTLVYVVPNTLASALLLWAAFGIKGPEENDGTGS